MKISDIAGLAKPLTRLIEVLSSGVGAVSRPYLIRRTADAKAYEIRVISDALEGLAGADQLPVVYSRGDVEIWKRPDDCSLKLESSSLEDRASFRSDYQERKRQHNIESVASIAAAELSSVTDVADESPDEDWITRFFASAQDVSSAQLQELWGRILAGEIKLPGSYSLKTLDFIRNLTKQDAALIEKVARLAIKTKGVSFLPTLEENWLQDEREIYPVHLFGLGELGAIYPTELSLRLFIDSSVREETFVSGDSVLLIRRGAIPDEIRLSGWKFTSVGSEVLTLVSRDPDYDYLEAIAIYLTNKGAQTVLARIAERFADGRIRFEVEREWGSDGSGNADGTIDPSSGT